MLTLGMLIYLSGLKYAAMIYEKNKIAYPIILLIKCTCTAEAWTLAKGTTTRLKFEILTYCRVLNISWVNKVTHQEVLEIMSKET